MLDFNDLLRDYSAKDQENITRLLAQLSQYIPLNQIIIVGGIATRYYLSGAGIDKPPFKLNDIDIALKCPFGRISPSLRKDFLIFHLHRKGALFYLTIANLHSKLKVDIFSTTRPRSKPRKLSSKIPTYR